MKIKAVRFWKEGLELTLPYTIAFQTVSAVENIFVRIELENGQIGLGAGSPAEFITGETFSGSMQLLGEHLEPLLLNQDIRHLPALLKKLDVPFLQHPAANAAIDIALFDAFTKYLGIPLVDFFGRAHQKLPTSITIGIKSLEETLAEAKQRVAEGFRIIKLKTGLEVDKDIEVFSRLRETVGKNVKIRVDANQGYRFESLNKFVKAAKPLDLEFMEQPFPEGSIDEMRQLPWEIRSLTAADEDLHSMKDAMKLAAKPFPYGIFNIKLMKCGGVRNARRIALVAEEAGLNLMWGCMDESIISISAALHAALASPATRYLDLDGSIDLARDIVKGGFELKDGYLSTTGQPGLGVIPL